VGDAAMAYDPLSSRGISAALESGMAAATFVGAPLSQLEARHEELTRRFQLYREARERHYATALDGSDEAFGV
jgi:flavin-dependent dehydrogenase